MTKNKAETMKVSPETSKKIQNKTKIFETENGKEFVNKDFSEFLNEKRKTHSRYTTKGAVTAECLKKLLDMFFKKLFLKEVMQFG